jgi:hypothetical protein
MFCSEFRYHVNWLVEANISEKHAASIFNLEDGDSMLLQDTGFYQALYTGPKLRRTAPPPLPNFISHKDIL